MLKVYVKPQKRSITKFLNIPNFQHSSQSNKSISLSVNLKMTSNCKKYHKKKIRKPNNKRSLSRKPMKMFKEVKIGNYQ